MKYKIQVFLFLLGACLQGHAQNMVGEHEALTDRLIIRYKNGGDFFTSEKRSVVKQFQRATGVGLMHRRKSFKGASVVSASKWMSPSDIQDYRTKLMKIDPTIESVEADVLAQTQATPNDPYYQYQWNLFEATGGINARPVWDGNAGVVMGPSLVPVGIKGSGITVAVLDTGYRPHIDFGTHVATGFDFVRDVGSAGDGNGRDTDALDPGNYLLAGECGVSSARSSTWHGTHVAGIIGAVGNNNIGISGVAPESTILPVRVSGKCGAYSSDISDAIVWTIGGGVSGVPANQRPARVINMSLGGPGACPSDIQSAINFANSYGAIVVVAAGNQNADVSQFFPANCSGVITVAATNRSGGRASYSNFGAGVTISAPGGSYSDQGGAIWSLMNNGAQTPGGDSYTDYQGTSMAAPHVSGVVALMLAKNSGLTRDSIVSLLRTNARAFPAVCNGCGSGIVNAYSTVLNVPSMYNSNPLPPLPRRQGG